MVTLAPSRSTPAVCADESASVVLDRPCLSCFPSAPCQCSCSCEEQRPQGSGLSETPPVLVTGVAASVRGILDCWRARDVSVLGGRGVFLAAAAQRSCFHTDFRWRMQTIALRSLCSCAASTARFAPCFAGRIGFRGNSRLCCTQSGSTWSSVSLGAPAIARGKLEAPARFERPSSWSMLQGGVALFGRRARCGEHCVCRQPRPQRLSRMALLSLEEHSLVTQAAVAGCRRLTFQVPHRRDVQPPGEGEDAGAVEELRQARVRAFVLGGVPAPVYRAMGLGVRPAEVSGRSTTARLAMSLGRAPACGAGVLAASSSRRSSREPQIPSSAPKSRASRRSRRVASGSFDGCLAEFGSLQRKPPAETCGAKLATTHSAAARTMSANRSGNSERGRREGGAQSAEALESPRSQLEAYPEAVTQTLRQNMARALRSDPSRTGCDRVGSFGFLRFSHQRDLGHVAATRAEVRNALEMQDVSMARAWVGLLLMAIEQTTRDF